MAKKKDFTEEQLKGKPSCFNPDQWARWSEKPRLDPNVIDWACQDCKPDFKQEMMAQGRCDWPCVKFVLMDDGTMEGRRTSITDYRGYPEGRIMSDDEAKALHHRRRIIPIVAV